jgi:hypothetical protein
MTLVDSNNRSIPACNLTGDQNLYVEDTEMYKNTVSKMEKSRLASCILSAITLLFLCIFTLNFGSSNWNASNLLTCGIIILTGTGTAYAFKIWNKESSLMQQMIIDGSPCVVETENSNTMLFNSADSTSKSFFDSFF